MSKQRLYSSCEVGVGGDNARMDSNSGTLVEKGSEKGKYKKVKRP